MNCDLNALFVARGGQMHLYIHRHHHLHLDYCGSPQNHTQFCFQMEVAKAKNKIKSFIMEKKNKQKSPPKNVGLECNVDYINSHYNEFLLDHLGDEVIPNAEVWMDEPFFKGGSRFLLHHWWRFWTGGAFLLYSWLPSGSTAWWQKPESFRSPVGGARRSWGV